MLSRCFEPSQPTCLHIFCCCYVQGKKDKQTLTFAVAKSAFHEEIPSANAATSISQLQKIGLEVFTPHVDFATAKKARGSFVAEK